MTKMAVLLKMAFLENPNNKSILNKMAKMIPKQKLCKEGLGREHNKNLDCKVCNIS